VRSVRCDSHADRIVSAQASEAYHRTVRSGRCLDALITGGGGLLESTRCKQLAPPQIDPGRWATALSDSHDLPKEQAETVLGDLVTLTTRHLKKGDKIRLTSLGILQVRKRAARMGRNPATGESIKIEARPDPRP
jgi:DNA-binding protein HU-beta